MSITTGEMVQKLTTVAKTGAKTNLEKKEVGRLAPVVIMAIKHTDEIKMTSIAVEDEKYLKDALKLCLQQYNAYAYTFITQGKGTVFPEALLMAKGNFNELPLEDRYEIATLQTIVKGSNIVSISIAKIDTFADNKSVGEWSDESITANSKFYITDW
tara:strand:+ start:401 stop:871 length:471 start_codon:yes stop_codon:yes gene_type:complete